MQVMAEAARRREIRRQRLLQNSEDRLKKILRVKNEKKNVETPDCGAETCYKRQTDGVEGESSKGRNETEATPISSTGKLLQRPEESASDHKEDLLPQQADSRKCDVSKDSHKNCEVVKKISDSADQNSERLPKAGTRTNETLQGDLKIRPKKEISQKAPNKTVAIDLWKRVDVKTLILILLAVIMRILVQFVSSNYLGKAVILVFFLTELTFHLVYGFNQRDQTSLIQQVYLATGILQDFAVYLFIFIITNIFMDALIPMEDDT